MTENLNRRCAEVLGRKWPFRYAAPGEAVIGAGEEIVEGPDGLLIGADEWWSAEQFDPCEDARQWSVLLGMMPGPELMRDAPDWEERLWVCVPVHHGYDWSYDASPGIAVVRAFLAWLEPMSVEERQKALGRTG